MPRSEVGPLSPAHFALGGVAGAALARDLETRRRIVQRRLNGDVDALEIETGPGAGVAWAAP